MRDTCFDRDATVGKLSVGLSAYKGMCFPFGLDCDLLDSGA
jgi:hypothetical protein